MRSDPQLLQARQRELEARPPTVLHAPDPGDRPFAYHVHLINLAEKARADERERKLSRAVDLFYGLGDSARETIDRLSLEAAQKLSGALARCKTRKTKIGVARLHVDHLCGLQSQRGGYRVSGPIVFAGHEYVMLGGKRVHLRKLDEKGDHQQGGLAQKYGVSVRTIRRWRAILTAGRVWKRIRPRRDAPDAKLTKSGAQVYSQFWLDGGTPKALITLLPPAQRHPRERVDLDVAAGALWRKDQWDEARARVDGDDREIPF